MRKYTCPYCEFPNDPPQEADQAYCEGDQYESHCESCGTSILWTAKVVVDFTLEVMGDEDAEDEEEEAEEGAAE